MRSRARAVGMCLRHERLLLLAVFVYLKLRLTSPSLLFCRMFATVSQTQTTQLWMWKMEYLHHEQRPLYFGEWF
jgi:hypothetical protein